MNALRTKKIQCTPHHFTPAGQKKIEAEDMRILNFQCQEADYKVIELKVKEALQEEPGADLGLVIRE